MNSVNSRPSVYVSLRHHITCDIRAHCAHLALTDVHHRRLYPRFYPPHPQGTAMYIKMTTGFDSYMHLAFTKGPKATQEIF